MNQRPLLVFLTMDSSAAKMVTFSPAGVEGPDANELEMSKGKRGPRRTFDQPDLVASIRLHVSYESKRC